MKPYVVIGGIGVLALIVGLVLLSSLDRPTETEFKLAKGRAQFATENYLAALKTLREIPSGENKDPEAHSYLGAAYLKLHLYKAAIKEFEEAAKLRPRESDALIGLASSYIRLGDIQKAIEQARRATEVEKRSVDAWIMLGRAQWQQRNFSEAENAALKARELDANHPAVADLLLHIYFDLNKPDKFEAELDRHATPPRAIQDLAIRFFLRQGQFARAYDFKIRSEKPALDRAILETELALKRDASTMELRPQLIRNLVKVGRFSDAVEAAAAYKGPVPIDVELGKAYWMLGRKDDAIQAFRRASAGLIHKLSAEVALAIMTRDPSHWREAYRSERIEQDHFMLARLEEVLPKADALFRAFSYRYVGVYDGYFYNRAAEEALKVLNDDPKSFDGLMTISTAYQRIGRIDDAMRYVQLARELYPKDAEPVSRLANLNLLVQQKDPQNIQKLMEEAVRLEPNNASCLYNLGWFYDQIGDTAKAAEMYGRAIRASRLSFEAMNNLALIYGNAGESERAFPLLEQAMRTDPENEAVYANLGNYYVRRREWKQALENLERAAQINPSNPIPPVEKGRVHLEIGQTDQAVDHLSQGLEIDPNNFDAYMLLSSAYEKMGHIKEAIASVEEAQRIRPDAMEVKETLDRLNARKESTN